MKLLAVALNRFVTDIALMLPSRSGCKSGKNWSLNKRMKQPERPTTRLVALINILSPYRVPIYEHLAEQFELLVLLAGSEGNRNWDAESLGHAIRVKTSKGITLRRRVHGVDGGVQDLGYLHLNPGVVIDLLRFRPNAIIANEMGLRSMIAIIYGRMFRTPVWIWSGVTAHSERARSRKKLRIRRFFFAKLTPRWISYGDAATRYLTSIGVKRARILQIQNTVDDRLFRPGVEPIELQVSHPRALFVGQLIGRKGISELLHATERLQSEGVACSLVIVGDGPEAERVDAEIAQRGLARVQRIPKISPDLIPGIYAACDFLVFPTLEDIWGLVVNEALLVGIPVIASQYAGCAEELLPPDNIFDPLDSDAFLRVYRKAAQGLLEKPETRHLKAVNDVAHMISEDVLAMVASRG